MKNSYFFQRPALRRNISFFKFFGLLAIMLFAGSGVTWGATITYKMNNSSSLPSGWSKTTRTAFQNYASKAQLQLQGPNGGVEGEVYSTITFSNVSAIDFEGTGSNAVTLTALYSTNNTTWTALSSTVAIPKNSTSTSNFSFSNVSELSGKTVYLKFRTSASSTYLFSISITTTESSCTTPTYSFDASIASKLTTDVAFTNAFTSNNTSTKVWSSTNEAVATVDAAGLVTIHSAGTTTIKVNQAADATYCAVVDESYVLTVTAPIVAEPTNQPTSFTATTNSASQITVDWTDASGGQVPDGYLVKASTGTPTAPVDGTPETAGTLLKIVTQGTQQAVFTGLSASTTYNFSIWPYTNSGAAIDYKTDGIVATASATTETPLGVPVATAATDVTPTGFTANWNAAASATGYELSVLKKDSEICNNPNEFFNETFGSNSANTDYSINNTFSTTSTNYIDSPENVSVNFSGDGRVGKNTTNPSTTYLGASGNSGAFRSNSSGTSTTVLLKISNIKIKDFQNIALSFGLYYTNGAIGSSSTVSVEYEIDGTGAKTFVFTQPSSTAVWTLCNGNINGSGSSLDLTFKLSTTGGYTARVDDIILKGCPVTPIPGSPFTVTETSKAVSGLNPGTEYFYTVVSKNASGSSAASNEISVTTPKITFTGTGEWTETARWNTGVVPGNTAQVVVDGDATINSNVEVAGLTINAGKSLTVNAAKQLTISGTATNNGTITIQSDASGTGTIVGNVSGAATVQQYLPGDGRQWWYLSSPVTGATSNVFAPTTSTNKIGIYVEDYLSDGNEATTAPYYTNPYAAGSSTPLSVGKGYVVKLSATTGGTYTFEGTLNNGDYTLSPTRTGVTAGKRGFNLVGNPYPSYLDWDAAYADASNVRKAIWYRTYSGGQMTFHTYADEDGVPATVSGIIPPAQAFWIRVNADGSNGTITFKNAHRSHAGATANPLKAPKANDRPRVRLQISNGVNADEALIVAKSYASNGIDSYDIEKMSNDNVEIPEIYTLLNNQDMVINSFNSFVAGQEIALGMRPGKAGDFTINATQFENIPSDIKVILKDKLTGAETELSENASYSFNADGTETNQRFSLLFRAPGSVTGIDNAGNNTLLVYAQQSEIVVNSEELKGSNITVYTATGQSVLKTVAAANREVLNGNFTPGVYFVKVNNTVKKVSVK